ncbi:MAG: amidohydrolase [Rhizobiaceae bacterium]|nr:amidohydrolase [Rhizobiaceae bacterium]
MSPETVVLRGLDAGIAADVAAVEAIDHHAHPMALGIELSGDPDQPIQPYDFGQPLRMRPDNPEYLDAWAGLWGYEDRDWSLANLARLVERKEAVIAEQGADYNVWILNRLKIRTMIGIAPGPLASLPPPRFRWCAFSDWFLWPFPVEGVLSPMQTGYRATNDRLTHEHSPAGRPSSVDAYIADVMIPVLARYAEQGAVGIKFHGPYNRPLNFDFVGAAHADALYARGLASGSLSAIDHKALQDFLFERLVILAGEQQLVVQMHTGYGVRPDFVIAGSNPLLMERIVHLAHRTKFVLLHGGWPFVRETVTMLANENVFTDFSCACLFHYPRALSHQIRAALEWYPEKLLYGTDAYSERAIAMLAGLPPKANPLGGWEEKAWLMNRTGRTALALALSGMQVDGEIGSERVAELIDKVMGGTAAELYRGL